jgi:peptidoglycan/LPS O-acetylase OafA/YrhL
MLLLSVMGISAAKLPRALIYLGRISFGLYVFHVLGLRIAASLLHKVGPGSSGIVETLLGLAVTISLAGLSYHFYEAPFLRLKKRLELVKSRPV